MNVANWLPYYKINPKTKQLAETNLLYTPLVNETNNILCLNFDHKHPYQNEGLGCTFPYREFYTEELVKFFFDREVKYLTVFAKYKWAPSIIDIDIRNQQIFLKWPGETLNNVIYSGRNLIEYCNDWQSQMTTIITDIVKEGYYKPTLYPHCYFVDNGQLKTIDFYACAEQTNPFIDFNMMKGMIGNLSQHRFEEAVNENNQVSIEVMFKQGMLKHIKWPTDEDLLITIYKKIYG